MMRRSPLTRKTPMNRGTGFKPRVLVKPSALAGENVKTLKVWKSAKPTLFRAEWLLALVRGLECMNCGIQGLTEAAHSNQLMFGKGQRIKASDATAMALCKTVPGRVGCHANHDQGGRLGKQEWKEFEFRMISKTILVLIRRELLKAEAGLLESLPDVQTNVEALCVALVEHIEKGRITIGEKSCH